MAQTLRRRVKFLLLRLGLYDAAWRLIAVLRRLRPRVWWNNRQLARTGAPDGFPLPPPQLAYEVAASYDLRYFLHSGEIGRQAIEEVLARGGTSIAAFTRVLDFGCGCGRMIRQWAGRNGLQLHGCDYNPRLVGWCRDNLPFAQFKRNGSDPPLDYPAGTFDFIYCLSVFTHMTEPQQAAWMNELSRVLAPRGHLLITTQSDYHLEAFEEAERAAYLSGELIVRSGQIPGSNLCETYHPPQYVRTHLSRGFEILAHHPGGQDLWLLRRP